MNCDPGQPPNPLTPGTCGPVKNFTKYWVGDFGGVRGADRMKAEIYARGPIGCGMSVTKKFEAYTGGIYSEFDVLPMINHEISLIGFGVDKDSGEEYWIGRNSWGTYWGEDGFFRMKMHHDNLAIETDCDWGVPQFSQVEDSVPEEKEPAEKVEEQDEKRPAFQKSSCVWRRDGVEEHVVSPRPQDYVKVQDLPATYDPRNINGVNFVTVNRNQHIPMYCGSCWAQGTIAALSDRIKLLRNAQWPDIQLSVQVLVDCVTANQSLGCNGGDPTAAYSWIKENGVTDDTCAPYRAENEACTAENKCMNCDPDKGCFAVENPTTYFVEEHGQIAGEENMMAEIHERGPIGCGVSVTEDFINYSGGIFVDHTNATEIDHEISVAGWGVSETGEKYWIGRNSWGTYWGEGGWFLITRGSGNNLAIETNCDWAVPKKNW